MPVRIRGGKRLKMSLIAGSYLNENNPCIRPVLTLSQKKKTNKNVCKKG